MSPAEICEKQNDIIRKQSDIIDDLFLQVIQYTDIEHEEKILSAIEDVARKEEELWKQ